MGLPLPANAPQITVGGRTYGVGAFNWITPDGDNFMFGVFELKGSGWDFVANPNYVALYLNPGELVAAVKSKGGIESFLAWIVQLVNEAFIRLFGGMTTPNAEDLKSDDEVIALIASRLANMKLILVNGVPFLA
jgi:hypothetical protein